MQPLPFGRRMFLGLAASPFLHGQTGKGSTSTFAPQGFLDPATEFDLYRLTNPSFNSWLPAPDLRFVARRNRFLIYAGDQSGSPQIYRLDLHSGESRQLTAASALDRKTPSLSGDDRSVYYFDGPALQQVNLSNLREREITKIAEGWERVPGFSFSSDGTTAAWIERQDGRYRVRVKKPSGNALSIAEENGSISGVQIRPGHPQAVYRVAGGLKITGLDGASPARELKLNGEGAIGESLWTTSGRTLVYLSIPPERTQLTTLRECAPDENTDVLLSKTSQFASFGMNGDSSVFVGASRSLASPYILLLLRVTHKELTLCEHRSSDPASVEPTFSPDSQSIYFTSDRKGKRAIYRAHVEKFVEETTDE